MARSRASSSIAESHAHVVAHVGDVHAKAQQAVDVLDRDGVVEVARVDRVDREGEAVADVATARIGGERLGDVELDLLGLGERLFRELGLEPVLADDDLDLDTLVALVPHDLVDDALGRLVA